MKNGPTVSWSGCLCNAEHAWVHQHTPVWPDLAPAAVQIEMPNTCAEVKKRRHSKEKALHHCAATFLRNTACLHPTTAHSPEKLYLQETNSQPHSHILEKQPAFQPRKLPAQLIRWKQGKFTRKKLLPFTPPIKKHKAITTSWSAALPTPSPSKKSSLGPWFSPYATHWPNLTKRFTF